MPSTSGSFRVLVTMTITRPLSLCTQKSDLLRGPKCRSLGPFPEWRGSQIIEKYTSGVPVQVHATPQVAKPSPATPCIKFAWVQLMSTLRRAMQAQTCIDFHQLHKKILGDDARQIVILARAVIVKEVGVRPSQENGQVCAPEMQ